MAKVELQGIRKQWGEVVSVNDMDLSVEDGEFIALLGPSGCGKTTTLLMLAGVYLPTAGSILFDGQVVNDVEARLRNVGIVFQSYALYPNMNVLQNILFPTRFQKLPDAEQRAREMADLVQIGELLERKPAELSGGQQQRVALARALIKRPNLLLLDEPLSNLDATLRLAMRSEIRRITRDLGVTTILVTHDQQEATTMADRIVCMNKGSIEQTGTAADLYLRPSSLFVAGFIGSPPINFVEALNSELMYPPGTTTIGIRPEMITAGEGTLNAKIQHNEPLGREILTTASSDIGVLRFLEATTQPRWKVGEQMKLSFSSADCIYFDDSGRRIDTSTTETVSPDHDSRPR